MSSRILDTAAWGALGLALAVLLLRAAPSLRYHETVAVTARAFEPGSAPTLGAPRSERILTANLFGGTVDLPGAEVSAAPAADAAPPVGLKLVGTLSGGPEPAAFIRPEGADSIAILYLGDWIGPERLLAVEANSILLEGPGGSRRIEVSQSVERGVSASLTRTADTITQIRRADIRAAYGSAEEILAGARPIPEIKNGQVVGFRMAQLDANSLFARMGIMQNDIIKSVNGYRIQSHEEGIAAFNRLKGASEVLLEVERNGTTQNIGYVLKP